jgi:hypothetical protein
MLKLIVPIHRKKRFNSRFSLNLRVYACGVWQIIVPRSQLLSPSEAQLLANIQRVTPAENAPTAIIYMANGQ